MRTKYDFSPGVRGKYAGGAEASMSDESAVNRELERELAEPFGQAWHESRHYILDSIACNLHNKGHQLSGNTEEKDADWLAALMWSNFPVFGAQVRSRFDDLPAHEQEHWKKIAACTIQCLPALMGRIAHRVILMSQAIRGMERAMRVERGRRQP